MLERFVDGALERLRAGDEMPAAALGVLLRVYAATGREDIGVQLEGALGRAIALPCDDLAVAERAEWLTLFAEAARYTDDDRLPRVAAAFAASLEARRDAAEDLATRAAAIAAVLNAAPILDARFAPAAVDELERLIAPRYAPGAGLRGCSAAESVAVAAALLAAFDVTGRLAYPMLAEELMMAARGDLGSAPPLAGCTAARVLSRLARLHEDDGYRTTAVVAPAVDFAADSASVLERIAPLCESPRERAAYALAFAERVERS